MSHCFLCNFIGGGTYITIAASPSSTVNDRSHFVFPSSPMAANNPKSADFDTLPPPPPELQSNGEASGGSLLPLPPSQFRPPQKPSWHKTVPTSAKNGGPEHAGSKNGGPEYAKIQRQGSQRQEPDNGAQNGEPATEAPSRSGSVKRKKIPARYIIILSFI